MKKPNILVVGSTNIDLIMYDIQRIPRYSESVLGDNYLYTTGGKGANQAYAAALQDANVTLVSRVGDDKNGDDTKRKLKKLGINTQFIVKDKREQTGLATIMVNKKGEYFSCVVLGANNLLNHEDVNDALTSFDFDMVLMQLEMPLETVYRTYELATEKKILSF